MIQASVQTYGSADDRGIATYEIGEGATVRRVESYIRAHLTEHLSAAELAAVAGVSIRSLFRAFKKDRRCSPMKILRAARLQQVRCDLLQGGDGRTITRIATDAGFVHLSRFSGLYKKTYGELPSETLRQVRHRDVFGRGDARERRAS